MAVTAYRSPRASDLSTRAVGDCVRFRCDTEAELPSSNVQNGDTAYTIDSKKMWDREGNSWVERGDASNTGGGGGLPAGLIVMWGGLLSAIPSGWLLCDGNNGTPDLRSKFIKGSAAAADPGATGGNLTHSHANHASHTHTYSQVVNHTHTVNVTDPGHFHTMLEGTTDGSGDFVDRSNAAAASNIVTSTATTGITASTVNPAGGVAQGTSDGPSATLTHDAVNHEPVYYSLAFIQKSA